MSLEKTSLNGLYYDQTSVRVKLSGNGLNVALAEFLQDISFSDSLTPTEIRGGHPVKLGTGLGTYQADCQLQILQEHWEDQVQPRLSELGGGAIGIVKFDLVVNFVGIGNGKINTIEVTECRVVGRQFPSKKGAEGLVRTIPLNVREIIENGVRLVPQRLD
jgi:hypothetical protein